MAGALTVLLCLGAGLIGGVFFAFSTFVMKALGELPAAAGVVAMQRINVVVLNRWFLGVFLGTALIALAAALLAVLHWDGPRAYFLLLSAALYLIGTFGVTAAFNVPRNQRLAGIDAQSQEAAAYWPTYQREWTGWNHVRTAASLASAGCAAIALAY